MIELLIGLLILVSLKIILIKVRFKLSYSSNLLFNVIVNRITAVNCKPNGW